MQINASLGSHTLSLFGATFERPEPLTLSPETLAAQARDPAKYREVAPTDPSSAIAEPAGQTGAGLKDSASAYRPSINPDFLKGIYADPRLTETGYGNAPEGVYTGPSYTERAGENGLLNTVIADIESIKTNQLAAMKEAFQARVETRIGRSLTAEENVYDFHTQAIISNEDWRLGMDTRVFESRAYDAPRLGDHDVRSSLTLENRTEEQRIEEQLQILAFVNLHSITESIRNANRAIDNGFGDPADRLPTLTEEEQAVLQQELYAVKKEAYESGQLKMSFFQT